MKKIVYNTINSRFGLLVLFALISTSIFTLTRIILLVDTASGIDWSLLNILQILIRGWYFDLSVNLFFLAPFAFILALMPERAYSSKAHKSIVYFGFIVCIYLLGFVAVSEWFFWQEFGVRFNFISVDYLIYRREVTENIQQSYPLPQIFTAIAAVTLLIFWRIRPAINRALKKSMPWPSRLIIATAMGAAFYLTIVVVNSGQRQFSNNRYQNELAGNGIYQFFHAYRNNELDYPEFYIQRNKKVVTRLLRQQVAEPNATFLDRDDYSIYRHIDNPGKEKRLNIMLVVLESHSAEYFKMFGYKNDSPEIEKIAKKGYNFIDFYGSGTRTVRGLESITMSFPPTPGRSIIKRPKNSDLFTLAAVLNPKGYQSKFLYGGDGYFDNMNNFFSGNGFQIVDRQVMKSDGDKFSFSNAWGVADEDIYRRALLEGDKSFAAGKPFFSLIMSTSNHRPYTYPEGRISIPSGTSHEGAARYADWALGNFINQARSKPWFDDTVFVIVADHCSGCAGKSALPVKRYHIPFIMYSPKHLEPKTISRLSGQIDIAPTLLAALNMDYNSWFFGKNILRMKPKDERALISNYQRLGILQGEKLRVLEPQQKAYEIIQPLGKAQHIDLPADSAELDSLVSLYQSAHYIYKERLNGWDYTRNKRAKPHLPVPSQSDGKE